VILFVVVAHILMIPARGDDAACVAHGADERTGKQDTAIPSVLPVSESFLTALNFERQTRNLPPVTYDASLETIGAWNNAAQASRGQGHWVTGGHGQCSYVGPFDAIGALLGFQYGYLSGPGYIHSAAHAGILFHRGLQRIGVHHEGNRNTVVCSFTQVDGPSFQPHQGAVAIPGDRTDPRNYIYGSVAQFGTPLKFVESKPGAQEAQATRACGQRRGFHPFARPFSRLRVQLSFGVQVSF